MKPYNIYTCESHERFLFESLLDWVRYAGRSDSSLLDAAELTSRSNREWPSSLRSRAAWRTNSCVSSSTQPTGFVGSPRGGTGTGFSTTVPPAAALVRIDCTSGAADEIRDRHLVNPDNAHRLSSCAEVAPMTASGSRRCRYNRTSARSSTPQCVPNQDAVRLWCDQHEVEDRFRANYDVRPHSLTANR